MLMSLSVCVTSILRMTTLKTGSTDPDTTYGTLNSTIWTAIEANTSIICACLPMLKSPLAALFPGLFPRGSSGAYNHSSGSHGHSRRQASAAPSSGSSKRKRTRSKHMSRSTQLSIALGNMSPDKSSEDGGKEEVLEVHGKKMPMSIITTTTHVDVEVGSGDGYKAEP